MLNCRYYALLFALVIMPFFSSAAPAAAPSCAAISAETIPQKLSETCLYDDIGQYLVSSQVTEFTPNYPLWTDGAGKTRWVYLPPDTKIDTSDPNRWIFPKGTLFFKEFTKTIPKDYFSVKQIKVETRLLAKVKDGAGVDAWLMLTYAWDENQKEALLSAGYENVLGTNHDIPTKTQCVQCHQGNADIILGFDPLQLSTERVWGLTNAIPASVMPAGKKYWNLELLQKNNLLTHPYKEQPAIPGPFTAKNALGYMHGNCGHCHNPLGKAFKEDVKHMVLRHDVTVKKLEDLPAYKTTVNQKTRNFTRAPYLIKGAQDDELAIYQSAIMLRMNSFLPKNRMPQIDTKEIDYTGLDHIHKWIQTLPTPDDLDLETPAAASPGKKAVKPSGGFMEKLKSWFSGAKSSGGPGIRGSFSFPNPKAAPRVAIVYLPEDDSLKAQPIMDHFDGDFTKTLVVGPPKEEIVLKNSDEVGHTIYAESNGSKLWDTDYMPAHTSTTRKIDWKEDEFVELKCKIHTYMQSWAGAIKTRYYKVVELGETQEASFEIKSFPPQFTQVKVWMPDYDPIVVKLKTGEKTTVNLMRKGQTRGTLTLDRQ